MSPVHHAISRRAVLKRLGALSAIGMLPSLASINAQAQAAPGYRALVCVFLYGGNDANNMIVPTDTAGFNTYTASRGGTAAASLALPGAGQAGGVLPLNGVPYALHPSMPEMQQLWNQGNVALMMNVGNLVRPLTKAAYLAAPSSATAVPQNLFSHADQQHQMQTTSLAGYPVTGWAGRIADQLGAAAGGSVAPSLSIAGNSVFLNGAVVQPIVLPAKGGLSYNGFNGSAASNARLSALRSLYGAAGDATLVSTLGGLQNTALATSDLLNPILSGASPLTALFPKYATSNLSQQLAQVARLIQANGQLGAPTRQIFFVSLGGFDTHTDQLNRQAPLLADLSSSLSGFYSALQSIGQQGNVTAFTLSDFARTLKPASGGGSDHAWGAHHLVVGGAVNGGLSTLQAGQTQAGIFGTFPNLALSGPSDVSSEGRWLPTTSIDQYAAALGKWFGLSAAQLQVALPNLPNFGTASLPGFLG